MQIHSPDIPTTSNPTAELDQLGDEIASYRRISRPPPPASSI